MGKLGAGSQDVTTAVIDIAALDTGVERPTRPATDHQTTLRITEGITP